MVRILCLHGIGTNGSIFAAQTSGFRALLPTHWEWEFPDAEIPCNPSSGISAIYPSPYLCYCTVPSVTGMQAAYEWVTDIIEEDGPYDGVMGFSAVHLRLPADTKTKGGGLGAAVILHHQLTNPYKPRLFRFAIFICAPLPWSIDRTSGVDVTSLIVGDVKVPVELLDIQKSLEEARNGSGETSTTNPPESVPNALRDAVSEVRRTIDGPYDHEQHPIRRFHPEVDLTRIELPTAHIVGKNDQVSDSSHQLIQLCDEKHAGVYEHAGGHEVWRTAGDLEMIKNLILKTVARGELM